MATTEVTNALYARYFPDHDSRYIDQQWKDHATPGYPANTPQQPVIRVSWNEAIDFCRQLSQETGLKFTLPTEAQWEWACRAGSDKPLWFGGLDDDFTPYANLADESLRGFVVKGVNPKRVAHEDWQAFIPRAEGLDDGQMITADVGSYAANPWGLHDMHGNVAEWTLSDDGPYPYRADDGRNAGDPTARKIVRGGSWRDRPHRARSGFRLPYPAWQKVFNVGFRVVMDAEPSDVAVTAAE
jgi:formylglycine-generating enzyme required for sulfatase activity